MTTGPDDQIRRDEADLAPFFAAARQARSAPSTALISAILADAGEESAARALAAPAATAPRQAPRRGLLATLGGWRVATTLVAASAFGFWIGVSGVVDVGGQVGWTASASTDSDGDPVAGFFDLASAE
jgi:hypothetical protein